MKKIQTLLLLFLVITVITLGGCTRKNTDEPDPDNKEVKVTNNPEVSEVVLNPTLLTVTEIPPTGSIPPNNNERDIFSGGLPVSFIYLAPGFKLEFFRDEIQYLYYGIMVLPSSCYRVEKIVSVDDELPEFSIIQLKSRLISSDECSENQVVQVISGQLPVTVRASIKVTVNEINAIKVYPTPTSF